MTIEIVLVHFWFFVKTKPLPILTCFGINIFVFSDDSETKEIEKKEDVTEATIEKSGKKKKEGKKPRFILFVGMFPLMATVFQVYGPESCKFL